MDHAPRTAGHSGLIERLLAGLAPQQEAYSLRVRCATLCIPAGPGAQLSLCDDSPFPSLPFLPALPACGDARLPYGESPPGPAATRASLSVGPSILPANYPTLPYATLAPFL